MNNNNDNNDNNDNNNPVSILMKPLIIASFFMSSLFMKAADPLDSSSEGSAKIDMPANVINKPSSQIVQSSSSEAFIDSLSLVDESLSQVLALLGKWTNRVIISGNDLPKVTFNLEIPMPLSRDEAVAVLKSALTANKIAVTPLGNKSLKVVPLSQAKSSSPAILKRQDLKRQIPSQEIACCLFHCNNLTAREAARTVIPWVTPLASSVVTLDKANSLFITDTLINLQQLDRLFDSIDKVGDIQDAILYFNPKNTSAEGLKAAFEDLQKGALKYYLLGNTSFAADKNTNLFVVVTPYGNERIIREFVDRLDANVDPLVQHHVFRIQHGSAKELTEMIKKLMQQQKDRMPSSMSMNFNNNNTEAFSKQLSLECDERLNAVIAYGTPSDIRQVQQLIESLDVVLPQVRIEVIVAEVVLEKGQASGLESFGYDYNLKRDDKDVDFKHQPRLNNVSGATFPDGSSIMTVSSMAFKKFSIAGILSTAKKKQNISILSSPTLLTTHAREAVLKVTETRPYLNAVQTKSSDTSDASIQNSTVEKVDAGIELTVKPLIGTNGMIQLEIDQKVDSFSAVTDSIGKITLPRISRRQAKSFVSVQSGDMIVLAGLKKRESTNGKKKMFLLGDLPGIGDALFTSKVKSEETTEMIIFIRPIVLMNKEASKVDTEQYTSRLNIMTQEEVKAYKENGNFSTKSVFDEEKKSRRKEHKIKAESSPKKVVRRHLRRVKSADNNISQHQHGVKSSVGLQKVRQQKKDNRQKNRQKFIPVRRRSHSR